MHVGPVDIPSGSEREGAESPAALPADHAQAVLFSCFVLLPTPWPRRHRRAKPCRWRDMPASGPGGERVALSSGWPGPGSVRSGPRARKVCTSQGSRGNCARFIHRHGGRLPGRGARPGDGQKDRRPVPKLAGTGTGTGYTRFHGDQFYGLLRGGTDPEPGIRRLLFHRCHQHRDFLPSRMPRGNSQAGKLPLIKDERTPPNNRLLRTTTGPKPRTCRAPAVRLLCCTG